MKNRSKIGIIIFVVFILWCVYDGYQEYKNVQEAKKQESVDKNDEIHTQIQAVTEDLEIHFLDVKQGDCTLIICDDDAMIIDAGNNGYGTLVKTYIEKQGITELDYVIGTHPDADHIGGLDVVIYNFDCGKIFMPDCSKDTKTYDDVIQTVKNKNYKIDLPVVGEKYELGDATFTIIAPLHYDYGDNYNDYSIAIMLEHGDNRFLFTGDCEEDAEADLIASDFDLDADLFKVAHHGSKTANTYEFLQEVTPTYCVVSCAEGNSFGHPHSAVLNDLRAMGVLLFRTDEQGTIVATSDGTEITFNMSPSDSWQSGE